MLGNDCSGGVLQEEIELNAYLLTMFQLLKFLVHTCENQKEREVGGLIRCLQSNLRYECLEYVLQLYQGLFLADYCSKYRYSVYW